MSDLHRTGRPILFSAPMILALIEGRKTQTRRLAVNEDGEPSIWTKILPGDLLWVRETHAIVPKTAYRASDGVQQTCSKDGFSAAVYWAGWDRSKGLRWLPSIHMPRWASRLTLEVENVRRERLQDISEDDALAEGCEPIMASDDEEAETYAAAKDVFSKVWVELHGDNDNAWLRNPEVVAISFRVHQRNIDHLTGAAANG